MFCQVVLLKKHMKLPGGLFLPVTVLRNVYKSVNRGNDADTTGAVENDCRKTHGLSAIPDHFKDKLIMYNELYETALDLVNTKIKSF